MCRIRINFAPILSMDSFLCSPIEVAIHQAILAGKDVCQLTHTIRKRGLFGITSASRDATPIGLMLFPKIESPRSPLFFNHLFFNN